MKKLEKSLKFLFLAVLFLSLFAACKAKDTSGLYKKDEKLEEVLSLEENSEARFEKSKELKKYKKPNQEDTRVQVDLKDGEELAYITKKTGLRDITDGKNSITPYLYVETELVRSRADGKILRIVDFGQPYILLEDNEGKWNSGDFSIDEKEDPMIYRVSSSGRFIIKKGDFKIGQDIEIESKDSVSTKLMTMDGEINFYKD